MKWRALFPFKRPPPSLAGLGYSKVVAVLFKFGFRAAKETLHHTVLSKANIYLTVPKVERVNITTLEGILDDAGIAREQFRGRL